MARPATTAIQLLVIIPPETAPRASSAVIQDSRPPPVAASGGQVRHGLVPPPDAGRTNSRRTPNRPKSTQERTTQSRPCSRAARQQVVGAMVIRQPQQPGRGDFHQKQGVHRQRQHRAREKHRQHAGTGAGRTSHSEAPRIVLMHDVDAKQPGLVTLAQDRTRQQTPVPFQTIERLGAAAPERNSSFLGMSKLIAPRSPRPRRRRRRDDQRDQHRSQERRRGGSAVQQIGTNQAPLRNTSAGLVIWRAATRSGRKRSARRFRCRCA